MFYETLFLVSLLITLIIEITVLFVFCKIIFKLKIRNLKILFVGFIASALTLPYLWFILPPYINAKYYICIGEILVFLAEALIYKQLLNLNIKKSLLVSFTANLFSFIFGLLIFNLANL